MTLRKWAPWVLVIGISIVACGENESPYGCELIDCQVDFMCVEDERGAGSCVPVEECSGFPIDCAAPPEGCDYVGGGCVEGRWTCGELTCEGGAP